MAIPSFYHPNLCSKEHSICLDASESAHAAKSRRLRPGNPVRVFNGRGLVGHGALSTVERREVTVSFNSFEQTVASLRSVSIAVAVPKGDRQKVMIDVLTQLGVSEIIPLRCEHSVTKFTENMSQKWLRAAVEACKQSQNPWLPVISNECDLDELLSDGNRSCVFANADGLPLSKLLDNCLNTTVLIGPEGGFSDNEFAKLKQFSVPSIAIGPYILRTEAAAIAAASVLIG